MSLFQEAARLNNEGVDSLLQGNQTSAIESMTNAVKLLKAELSSRLTSTSCDDSTQHAKHDTCTVEISSMESSDTIVFNQAIRIPDHVDQHQNLNDVDINVYTCSVIYNLALTHHFQASFGNTSLMMAKAEKLYGMVLKLLNMKSLTVPTALIVKLACINNLAQIRYSRGEYNTAKEGLSLVSDFLRQSPKNQALFEEPKVQGLLMNVLLLKAPRVAPAA